MIKAGCYVCLRYAQTTVGDLGFAARSVGISLSPGLVDFVDGPSLSADPPVLAAKQETLQKYED